MWGALADPILVSRHDDEEETMSGTRGMLRLLGTALVAAAVVLAGCTAGGGGDATDKAGGSAKPVTLRLGTPDQQGQPTSGDLEHFAAQVNDISGGKLRIDITWETQGPGVSRYDQRVAEQLQAGELDLALVPTRAWDELGVTSLQALQAPFLITTKALLDQVVSGPMAGEMLGGMDKAGVVGLGLWPEGLRHPFGFHRPLATPADFDGSTINAPLSRASFELLRALGATPVNPDAEDFQAAYKEGTIDGAESSMEWAGGTLPPATVAGNITFFPKVNALVANSQAFKALSDEQRNLLRRAAADTLQHVIQTNVPDAKAASQYCGVGGRVIVTSQANLATLERAARPVYAALERDAATKTLIAKIRALKAQGSASEPIATCTPGTKQQPPPSGQTGAFPEGVFRKTMTADEMIAAGLTEMDAHNNAGIQTLRFEDGRWVHTQRSPLNAPPCPGRYTVTGNRVSFDSGQSPACGTTGVRLSANWTLEGGELSFTNVRPDALFSQVFWGGKPWRKIS